MRRVLAAITLIFLTACAGTLEQRMLTTLDTAATLAVATCDARKQALAAAHEPEKLEATIAQCEAVFDQLTRAVGLVETGNVAEAEQVYRDVAKLARELRSAQ
jgi:Zn-dependent oligopeptidase